MDGKPEEKLVAIKEIKLKKKDKENEDREAGRQFLEFQRFFFCFLFFFFFFLSPLFSFFIIREAFIMSKLKHENLVRLYGISLRPKVRMFMEFVPGGDLQVKFY